MNHMKNTHQKVSRWILASLSIFLLTACGIFSSDSEEDETIEEDTTEEIEPTENEEVEEVSVNQDLAAWLPRLNNVVYHYDGSGNEYAPFKWTPQFNEEDYYQTARDNSGTTVVEVYQYMDDEITRVHSQEETYYRDNLTSIWGLDRFEEEEIILKTPIAVGTSWSNNDTSYEITAIEMEIEVPAGTYQTIEVTIENENSIIKRYYAEEVGLVYEQTDLTELTIESKLAEIQKDTAEKIPLTIYQADDQLMALDAIDAELSLDTNEPARFALTELLTGEKEGMEDIFLMPKGSEINYLFLNKDNIVEVDLSSEYISNMNTGSSGEQFALQGLVNTLTQYYGVEDLLLTIDGGQYESGHILLEKDELMSFDDRNINE